MTHTSRILQFCATFQPPRPERLFVPHTDSEILHPLLMFNLNCRYDRNYTGDNYNRIWKAYGSPDYRNISSPPLHGGYVPNEIPKLVLLDAIEPLDPSNSIVVSQNLNQTQNPFCVILYFRELNNRSVNYSRKFQIDIRSQKNVSLVSLNVSQPQLVTLFPEKIDGPINITISPVNGSTLPPILNAMELYAVMKMKATAATTSQAGSVCLPFFFFLLICLLCSFVV